jgi:uncharacterized membrane protein
MSLDRRTQAFGPTPDPDPPTVSLRRPRLVGVDVARGLALLGMLAVHVLPDFTRNGVPTATTMIAGGRSAATFVLVAGVGLAFVSGGRTVVRGAERVGVSAGIAVRAALIGTLGLFLGLLSEYNEIAGILPYYGLFFLLAIPLLGLTPRGLAAVAAAVVVLGPVLLLGAAGHDGLDLDGDPTPGTLLEDPTGVFALLTVTGDYPALVYLAYLVTGLAIGRLDLGSRRVAWSLFGAGTALAVLARLASIVLLYPLGGLAELTSQLDSEDTAAEVARKLFWTPDPSSSWWYLALPAPHSHSTIDVLHTLGSAVAVLGAALLLSRIPLVTRLLEPVAAAGSMALTLYSAHLVLLATGLLEDTPRVLYVLMVIGALTFAHFWRRRVGAGPLERVVSRAAAVARQAGTRLAA